MKHIANYFRSYIKFYKSTAVVATGSVNVLKTVASHNKCRICVVHSYPRKAIWKETVSLGHRT